MTAQEHLQSGRPAEALAALQEQVRANPADAKLRVFLFQLLSLLGQWQRAATQLNLVGDMDPGTLAMKATYEDALQCEVLRPTVFAGERSPLVFGEPEQWIAQLIGAQQTFAAGEYKAFQAALEASLDEAPEVSGTINGEPFEWIADADSRLGPILELVLNGRYYWVPFSRISKILIEPPSDLRDAIWTPANFVWANEGEAVGLIPTRYVGSEQAEDGALCLARSTEWQQPAENLYQGLGQRVLMTDSSEYPLMEVREITLNTQSRA
ncbi:MAG: type VI secretion system accessory protein TagJ [Pseudomonadota bacterium]